MKAFVFLLLFVSLCQTALADESTRNFDTESGLRFGVGTKLGLVGGSGVTTGLLVPFEWNRSRLEFSGFGGLTVSKRSNLCGAGGCGEFRILDVDVGLAYHYVAHRTGMTSVYVGARAAIRYSHSDFGEIFDMDYWGGSGGPVVGATFHANEQLGFGLEVGLDVFYEDFDEYYLVSVSTAAGLTARYLF